MTIAAIRKQLMTYLADADDEKVKALYTILANDMKEQGDFVLSETQVSILEERKATYSTGKSKGSTWKEVKERVQNSRKRS
jgi:hypothetical protein